MENSVHNSPFKGKKSNNENELNSETASKIKNPRKKQLPPKNFMNPTISASIRASTPRKKILGERNESEHNSLRRSSSFDSNTLKSSVIDSDDDKPYDPVTNYLTPRPKFLRYDPNRRRNIVNLQENSEDLVKISTYYDAGNGSTVTSDSCSEQESGEEMVSVKNEEDEVENGEECESEDEEEEEMDEIEDGGCCSLIGFFKFLCVVAALIITTHAICSMKCPSPSQTVESVWGDHVFGLNSSEVVEYGLIKEPDLLVGRSEVGDVVDYGGYEFVEDYVHQDEVENDETSVTRDETLEEHETEASEVVEIDDTEAEEEHDFNEDGVMEDDDDSDASKVMEIHDAEVEEDHEFNKDGVIEEDESDADETEFETANAMEDGVEKEIKRASFVPTVEVLVAPMLVLISFGVVYRLKYAKVRKEESKELKPSANPQSTTQKKEQEPLQNKEEEEDAFAPFAASLAPQSQNDISKEIISHSHTPSVELLSEFTFGEEEELTSTTKHSNNSLIQTTAVSSSQATKTSHMETSTADSAKKQGQRRRNAEIVTPSPVRRSSRLKSRSIASP